LTPEVAAHYRTIEHIGFLGDFLQSETSPYYHSAKINPGSLDWQSPAYMDFKKVPALIKLLKENHSVVTPTSVTIDYQLRLDTDAKAFIDAGIEGYRANQISQYYPDYYYDIWLNQYKTWGYGLDNPKRLELVKGFANEKKLAKLLDDAGVPVIA